jgi:hypothetical protein
MEIMVGQLNIRIMKLQKCTIAIHPVVAKMNPELLAKLMTWDSYCKPIKTYKSYKNRDGKFSNEWGPKCTLYFKKKLHKQELRRLNTFEMTGLFLHFGNTYDEPCLIQNGHDSSYAVWLYTAEDIQRMVKEVISDVFNITSQQNTKGESIKELIKLI